MSNTKNQDYVEQKWDVFRFALENDDFDLAQAVIRDLFDHGFEDEAFNLASTLQKSELYDRYETKPVVI